MSKTFKSFFQASLVGLIILISIFKSQIVPSPVMADSDNDEHKVTICHATSSSDNPFTTNTVDKDSAGADHAGNHGSHEEDIIPSYDYNFNHAGENIIGRYPGKNWTTESEAFLENGCKPVTPPPADVCPNINGDQGTVPDGYVKDDAGNCVLPPPPTDVCPNIEGPQETIPEGYVKNDAGNCVLPPPPIDLCSNIDGDQATIPDGKYAEGDQCVNKTKVCRDQTASNYDSDFNAAKEIADNSVCTYSSSAPAPSNNNSDNNSNNNSSNNSSSSNTTETQGQVLGATLAETGVAEDVIMNALGSLGGLMTVAGSVLYGKKKRS